MLIKAFSVLHIFVFPLDFEIDFSEVNYESLKAKDEIIGIIRHDVWTGEKDSVFIKETTNISYSIYVETFPKIYSYLFSNHFLKSERNIRLFIKGGKVNDMNGIQRDTLINCLVDKRGFIILTFKMDYCYETPQSSEEVINELYTPHSKNDWLSSTVLDSSTEQFNVIAKKFAEHVKGYFVGKSRRPKLKELLLSPYDLDQFYEPYAVTFVNEYNIQDGEEIESTRNLNEMLKILFWDKKLVEEFRPENVKKFYKEISRTHNEVTFLSAESTLMVKVERNEKTVRNFDATLLLVNIELLLIQKQVLQIYDHIIDNILHNLRQRHYRMSTVLDIRNYVARDLEEFFDIRIKNYQRGREVTDAGREILNLDQFYYEVSQKVNTLDTLISARNNQYLQGLIALLTMISVITVGFVSTYQIVQGQMKNYWIFGYLILVVVAVLYFFLRPLAERIHRIK